jgi:hypothetical protein
LKRRSGAPTSRGDAIPEPLRSRIEQLYARHVAAFTACAEFETIESGRATVEAYDGFLLSVVRAHLKSPQLIAFLYSMAPPRAQENLLHNLLEELGIEEESGEEDPARGRAVSIIPDVEASRYDLLVELARGTSAPAPLADFVAAFDRTLASVNIEYAAKRGSKRLAGPRLHLMRPGWAEKMCRQEFSQGRRESQHKWKTIRVEWDDASRAEVVETLG